MFKRGDFLTHNTVCLRTVIYLRFISSVLVGQDGDMAIKEKEFQGSEGL